MRGVARRRDADEQGKRPEPFAVLQRDGVAPGASPATRSISSRTAVESSGMSPPASERELGPTLASSPREQPRERPLPVDARRGRSGVARPTGIAGSG